jgi:hypothetical protein
LNEGKRNSERGFRGTASQYFRTPVSMAFLWDFTILRPSSERSNVPNTSWQSSLKRGLELNDGDYVHNKWLPFPKVLTRSVLSHERYMMSNILISLTSNP